MREKKQFFIPKNYDKKFEWIPGISGWQHVAFLPIIALDFMVLQHTPFNFSNKVTFIAISLGLPWILMGTHPIRENVPLYKHLQWKLKFLTRQRLFQYRKEGYVNEVDQSQDKGERSKTAGESTEVRSAVDSDQGDRAGEANHARQQNGPMLESVSHKPGADKQRGVQ